MIGGRQIRALAAGAALCMLFAACTKIGGQAPGLRGHAFTEPHVLRWSDGEDIHTLNPHLNQLSNLSLLSELTMAWLARYDHQNQPIPELATEIPTKRNGGISADGKAITWHLRRGVKWSDGHPFDADDVAFSVSVVNNPRNNEVSRDGWDLITKVDEPDKYTIVMHLKKPFASYLPTFFGTGGANPCLLPKHILGNLPDINSAAYNALPIGIGPFRYVSWKRSDSVTLEANPNYWRGKPKLQKIVFAIIPDNNTVLTQIQGGSLDMWVYVPYGFSSRLKSIPGFAPMRRPSSFYDHIDFNTQHAVGSDPVVRQALRYATDRRTLIEKVNHGLGLLSESVVPVALPAYDKSIPPVPFDLARGNRMLDAAGWKVGSDGVRSKGGVKLSFEFATVSGAPDRDERIELVRGWWKAVGATLTVRHYLPSVLFAPYKSGGILYTGKFDAVTFAWGGDTIGNVANQYACNQIPPDGQNVSRYCNGAATQAMERFKLEYDPQKRQPISNLVQTRIAADVPVIVLDSREELYESNTDLKNFNPNAQTPFDDMMNVDI